MGQAWELIKKYGGALLLGFGVVGLVGALGVVFWLLMKLVPIGGPAGGSLPLLAIGGVVVLILMLTAVAMIFSILDLTNKDQAMGLPEGSIRAVIALSLIVLFAILSVFLYQGVSTSGPLNTIANLSDTERAQFIRDHAGARDIQSVVVKDKDGEPLVVKDKDGQPLRNTDGTPKYFYDVSYRSTNAASDDFAKQLLVLLGTLMTAITSFYLGAGTATSAAAAGQTGTSAKPTLSGINPTTFAIANGTVHLDVAGAGLNVFTSVKIVKSGVQILGTNVSSNANHVFCDINVSTATPGTWDVVVDDGGSNSATLPDALTLT
jgi:hypothetical protein